MGWTTPGTATAGDVLTASFWNTQVRDQMIEVAPVMAAWTSFTPALKGSTSNPTLGTGSSASGNYLKIGKLLIVQAIVTFGTSGVVNGSGVILMDLPGSFTLSSIATSSALGSAAMLDASANRAYGMTVTGSSGIGTSAQICFRLFDSTGGAYMFYDNPVVLAASDSFRVGYTAEIT